MAKRGKKRGFEYEVYPIEMSCVVVEDKIFCASSQGEIFSGYFDKVVLEDQSGNELASFLTAYSRDKGVVMKGRLTTLGTPYELRCRKEKDEEGLDVLVCTLKTEESEERWSKRRSIVVGSPPF